MRLHLHILQGVRKSKDSQLHNDIAVVGFVVVYVIPLGLFKTNFKFIVQNSHVALLSGQEIESGSWRGQLLLCPQHNPAQHMYQGGRQTRRVGRLAVIRQLPAASFTFVLWLRRA